MYKHHKGIAKGMRQRPIQGGNPGAQWAGHPLTFLWTEIMSITEDPTLLQGQVYAFRRHDPCSFTAVSI
jgi:hypothetical protein